MKRIVVLVVLLFACALSAFAQGQSYVSRFDAFTGYSYLAAPKMNLVQRGFNGEFGVNINRWLALGADYSVFTGHSSLTPDMLTPALQQQLAPLAGLFPPGYVLAVPYDATTYTYSAGPQLNYRHWDKVTFFVRPALGAMHEKVTARPADALQTMVVSGLVPGNIKTDTAAFYGGSGGFDLNISRHIGIRLAADFVHVYLFNGFLKEGRNSVRFSIGPTWRWGKNVN